MNSDTRTFIGSIVGQHQVVTTSTGKEMFQIEMQSVNSSDTTTFRMWPYVGEIMVGKNQPGVLWSVDYSVYFTSDGNELYTIKKASAAQGSTPQPATVQAPPVAQATPAPATPVLGSRDLSIIRQVAFKAAVERTNGSPENVRDLTDQYERILLNLPLEDEHEEEDLLIEVAE